MVTELQRPSPEFGTVGAAESNTSTISAQTVRLTMLSVGLAQTVIVGLVVKSSGILQDDYLYFYLARQNGLTLHGLTISVFGSLIPGFAFVNTILSQQSPIPTYEMTLVVILLYMALILVLYRFLEMLFGARLIVVVLTAVATCSGLLGVSLVWWTPAINSLPAVIADILALDGLARHALTRRRRHLVISVVSFAVGTLFYDPSMTIVLTLVLFTALYLANPRDWRSEWDAFRSRSWVWVGYAVPITAALAWRRLHPAEYGLPPVANAARTLRFMGTGWAQGFAPSSLGFNYSILGSGSWRFVVVLLGQLLLIGVGILSVIRRRIAWRAWFLFCSSFLVADLVAAIGRGSLHTTYALNSLYWLFYGFLFWIAIGLAFLPCHLLDRFGSVAGKLPSRGLHAKPKRLPRGYSVLALVMALVLCVLGLHYDWTTPDKTMGAQNASYIRNVRITWEKVKVRQPTAFIWNTDVPSYVLAGIFAPYNRVASTIGLVVGGLRFDSVYGPSYFVAPDGRLVPARSGVISRVSPTSTVVGDPVGRTCLPSSKSSTLNALPMTNTVPKGDWFVRVNYTGSSGFTMTFDDQILNLTKHDGSILMPWFFPTSTKVFGFVLPKNASICLSLDVERPVQHGAPVSTDS